MKKMLIASIIGIMSFSSSAQVLNEKDITVKRADFVSSMKQIKDDSLMKGVLGSNAERMNFFALNTPSYYKNMNNVCKINFQIDDKGKIETILANDFVKLDYFKTILINQSEEVFFADFYSRYLIAGCQYGEYKNPIQLSKSEKVNEAMNLIFGHIESNYGPSINNIVQENYANALSTIQMIIKFGPRDEVLSTLRKASALTDIQYTLWSLNGYFRVMTGTSIKILLLPENLKRISQISQNDSEKMEILALEIANIASVYDMASLNSNLKEYLYSIDNLNLIVGIKTYDLIKKSMPEIFKQEIAQEKDVQSYTELMSKKIMQKIKMNGELVNIQKSFKTLQAIKATDNKIIEKSKDELERKIKEIVNNEIKNYNDFMAWDFNSKNKLTNQFFDELDDYGFEERRVENKSKISPENLVTMAMPEIKIYKGLLDNKMSLVFYQSYQKIKENLGSKKEIDKSKMISKYR